MIIVKQFYFDFTSGLGKRLMKWTTLDAANKPNIPFQKLSEGEIIEVVIGVYQLKTAKSYYLNILQILVFSYCQQCLTKY